MFDSAQEERVHQFVVPARGSADCFLGDIHRGWQGVPVTAMEINYNFILIGAEIPGAIISIKPKPTSRSTGPQDLAEHFPLIVQDVL